MQNRLERRLKITVASLVFVSHLALAITPRFPVIILLVPVATFLLMPLAERIDRRFRLYRRFTELCTYTFILALLLWFMQRGVSIAIPLLATLTIYVQVYSLLHRKSERNYNHIMLMSFFLLLMALVSEPPPSISIVLVMFLGVSTWALVLLEMYSANDVPGAVPVAQIVRLDQRDVPPAARRKRIVDPLFNSWVFAFSLCTLVVGVGFFMVVPRTEVGLIGSSNSTDLFTTGLSDEVDLTQSGLIQQDTSAVMYVVFPEEENGQYNGELLWRSTTFDHYTGNSWTRRGMRWFGSQIVDPHARRFSVRTGVRGSPEGVYRIDDFENAHLVTQQIFLNRTPDIGLPALPLVKTIVPDDMSKRYRLAWDVAGDFTVRVSATNDNSMRYTVVSNVARPSPEKLRASDEDFAFLLYPADYRLLTNHNLREETQKIVRDVTGGKSTAYDKIKALEIWLSEGEFSYSLNVPELPDDHPMDFFIRNTKMGHCELYASALALMVRSLGIPARLVNGYRGGNWNPDDRSYIVTADMAHVWAEVFFIDYGWIPFDPSPPQERVGLTMMGSLMSMISQFTMRARLFWLRDVLGFSPKDRVDLFKNVSLGLFTSKGSGKSEVKPVKRDSVVAIRVPQLLTILIAMTGAAVLLHLMLSMRRRSRSLRSLTQDQRRATSMYRALLRRLQKVGLECKGKSAEELIEDIRVQGWKNADEIAPIILKYNAVRFGQAPFPATQYGAMYKTARSLRVVSD